MIFDDFSLLSKVGQNGGRSFIVFPCGFAVIVVHFGSEADLLGLFYLLFDGAVE
jgi:hypothetical protein